MSVYVALNTRSIAELDIGFRGMIQMLWHLWNVDCGLIIVRIMSNLRQKNGGVYWLSENNGPFLTN